MTIHFRPSGKEAKYEADVAAVRPDGRDEAARRGRHSDVCRCQPTVGMLITVVWDSQERGYEMLRIHEEPWPRRSTAGKVDAPEERSAQVTDVVCP